MKLSPTNALSYDIHDSTYWDGPSLQTEVNRIFDICHGCRLCFNVCPSFNILFNVIDDSEKDVSELSNTSTAEVMEACYQCKLCYNKCPYTPSENHEYQLDFPRLVMRWQAQHAKNNGISWRDKLFARPEILGWIGGLFPWLANWANQNIINRKFMQWVMGIHAHKSLPTFSKHTFQKWFYKRPLHSKGETKVVLFHTCYVNYNAADIGEDTISVLEQNKIEVIIPKEQVCCGMPALDQGDITLAQKRAHKNITVLMPYVENGLPIIAINPTCSLMLKEEIPRLLKGTSTESQAQLISKATKDLGEYLFELKKEGRLNENFGSLKAGDQKIAYQVPCHLRAQNIGFKMRDLLKLIPGVTVGPVMECTGHDGTWAMKKEFYELSKQAGEKCFTQVNAQNPDVVSTDCPLAALQIKQHTQKPTCHPIQLIAQSYRNRKQL